LRVQTGCRGRAGPVAAVGSPRVSPRLSVIGPGPVVSCRHLILPKRPLLEAERADELEALENEHKRRLKAVKKEAEAGARRQKEFLRSIGVPDLSPEEITQRARRPSAERP
jgi:hypothetical protein